MPDTATAKNKNRRMRQEALREQISQQKHHEHLLDIVNKIMDEGQEITPEMMQRYKVVIDAKFKLMAKYIPDLKQADFNIGGQEDNPLQIFAWEKDD